MSFTQLIATIDRTAQALLGGEPVIYRPTVGDPVTVTGLFDAQYVLIQGSAHAGVEGRGPAVSLRLEDLPGDPEQDSPTVTIRGVDYDVLAAKPDGIGGIVLVLRKVA
ncbi:MAG TPA: hypothetical protein VFK02_06580 [Kofleriaceae bacterium]|nr:hypothetical protein [Kofleriaceae bacterium]